MLARVDPQRGPKPTSANWRDLEVPATLGGGSFGDEVLAMRAFREKVGAWRAPDERRPPLPDELSFDERLANLAKSFPQFPDELLREKLWHGARVRGRSAATHTCEVHDMAATIFPLSSATKRCAREQPIEWPVQTASGPPPMMLRPA